MNAIAEKEGFEVEYVSVSWDPMLAGMASCQYDAAISAIAILEERKPSMSFSEPYYKTGQAITVSAENIDIVDEKKLADKVVGVLLGTTAEFEVKKIKDAKVKTYDDIGLAFQDLLNGQIDAVVADDPLSRNYIAKNPNKIKIVGAVVKYRVFWNCCL